jgi:hypothetical protein
MPTGSRENSSDAGRLELAFATDPITTGAPSGAVAVTRPRVTASVFSSGPIATVP